MADEQHVQVVNPFFIFTGRVVDVSDAGIEADLSTVDTVCETVMRRRIRLLLSDTAGRTDYRVGDHITCYSLEEGGFIYIFDDAVGVCTPGARCGVYRKTEDSPLGAELFGERVADYEKRAYEAHLRRKHQALAQGERDPAMAGEIRALYAADPRLEGHFDDPTHQSIAQ